MSTANHPQTDGQSERTIQVINRMVKTYASIDHQHWDDYLPMIEFVYNSTVHKTINCTPFEADLGYTPTAPTLITAHEFSARSATVPTIVNPLKAIETRARAFLLENQEEMEKAPLISIL